MRASNSAHSYVTASASLVSAMFKAAERIGVEPDELQDVAGVPKSENLDPSERVCIGTVGSIDEAMRKCLGKSSAIKLGEAIGQDNVSMLAYVLKGSRTLREYFQNICEYWSVVMDVQSPALEVRGDKAIFGCIYSEEIVEALPLSLERDFAEWLSRARTLSCVDWAPLEVMLQTPATDTDEYARFFRAPVTNDAPGTWLIFDANVLDYPIPEADGFLLELLLPRIRHAKEKVSRTESLVDRVEKILQEAIQQDCAHIAVVARKLAMSSRTLQRKLVAEGTTFANLLDDVRRKAAMLYLRDSSVAISETAHRLGFSEPSTFYRAFRRWTGDTPANYRRLLTN